MGSVDRIKNESVESSSIDNGKTKLTKEQTLMLKFSDKDIKQGKFILQSELDKADLKWLKDASVE